MSQAIDDDIKEAPWAILVPTCWTQEWQPCNWHAAGMQVSWQRLHGDSTETIQQFTLNADDRNSDGALPDSDAMRSGCYRLLFEVAPYFRSLGVVLPEPAFLDTVPLEFGIADPTDHYHVPLLATPWCDSTYRGS